MRRYLWSNIRIDGDGLEYTGTGRELFLGFLIALAVLAPLSIAYIVAYRLIARQSGIGGEHPGRYFLALFIFLQVALFRSRRYRLSRTIWRGIYAGQTGSTWHYLGLYPRLWRADNRDARLGAAVDACRARPLQAQQHHLRQSHHAYRGKGSALFWRWLVVIALLVIPVALAMLPNLSAFMHPVYVPQPKGPPRQLIPHPGAFAFFFLAAFLGGLALVWYRIEAFRYLASRVRLGTMQLHSDAKGMSGVGRVLLFYLGLIGISIAMGIVFFIVGMAAVPIAKGVIAGKAIAPQMLVLIAVGVMLPIYIILLWVMQIVTYCWLWIPIIKHLATTLDIENFAAVDEITQSTQPRQKLGIADSFELGAF